MKAVIVALVLLSVALDDGEAAMSEAWESGSTGRGTARWEVSERQVVYRGGADFGWAVSGPALADGFVEVRFRPLDGRADQAGGVVWRWRDANNYYIARANALEDNVVAYKMVNGRRTDLKPVGAGARAYGVSATVAPKAWHTLRVEFSGGEFAVRFDAGAAAFTVRDETLKSAGRVGVWSKADSVTEFDEFRYGRSGG
ncbi:MAG: hypothetical protein DMD78_00750 [Candidatus Rokuibacteriota bacterium]|nr:MAG: hypothetical protein DMD78_00750 [Candidatus Rokubacteria bacterium]